MNWKKVRKCLKLLILLIAATVGTVVTGTFFVSAIVTRDFFLRDVSAPLFIISIMVSICGICLTILEVNRVG